jgi:hypothetical protein
VRITYDASVESQSTHVPPAPKNLAEMTEIARLEYELKKAIEAADNAPDAKRVYESGRPDGIAHQRRVYEQYRIAEMSRMGNENALLRSRIKELEERVDTDNWAKVQSQRQELARLGKAHVELGERLRRERDQALKERDEAHSRGYAVGYDEAMKRVLAAVTEKE